MCATQDTQVNTELVDGCCEEVLVDQLPLSHRSHGAVRLVVVIRRTLEVLPTIVLPAKLSLSWGGIFDSDLQPRDTDDVSHMHDARHGYD